MIEFPNISPDIVSFSIADFEITIRWYAVSYIAGFLAASYLMRFLIRRGDLWKYRTAPMESEQSDALITYLVLAVIIGGRLGYVCFYNLNFYLQNPSDIIRVWDGGMAFHGGFIGVALTVIFYFRFNGIPTLSGADLIAVATPPGLLFGRLANFINAELWGRPTDVPWGVVFPGERAQTCEGIIGDCARHPSQIYEAGLEGLLLFLVLISLVYMGFLKRPGFITGIFIAGYGSSRFFVEYFRVADTQFMTLDNPMGYVFIYGVLGIKMGQLLSVPMIILGILFILFARREKNRAID